MRHSFFRPILPVATFLLATVTGAAQASSVPVITDGRWYSFDVDEVIATSGGLEWIDAITDSEGGYNGDGSALSFTFALSQAAQLTIVDAGFGGDRFQVNINGEEYLTSLVPASAGDSLVTDFDAALNAYDHYSSLTLMLGAGEYTIGGALFASALDESGAPYNATVGGIRVSEVPLPAAGWLFASALLAGFGFIRRRAI